MSEKTKYPIAKAQEVAGQIVAILAPHCQRIIVAGSIRRQKPFVSDIEILFIPTIEERQFDLLSKKSVNVTDEQIEKLVSDGILEKRITTSRVAIWGIKNKLAVHVASGIPVDLFSEPDPQDWPRSLCIRTGPKDFNIRLMATAPRVGYNAHAYGEALHRIPGGERVIVADEREFIEKCGLKYVEPNQRV